MLFRQACASIDQVEDASGDDLVGSGCVGEGRGGAGLGDGEAMSQQHIEVGGMGDHGVADA